MTFLSAFAGLLTIAVVVILSRPAPSSGGARATTIGSCSVVLPAQGASLDASVVAPPTRATSLGPSAGEPPALPPVAGSGAADPPDDVLLWMETTPPGATIRRLKDGFVLGITPETIAIRRSNEPVRVRFELRGYRAETRDVSTAGDGTVSASLTPIENR
ncbi:MAG: hypothetical protein QM784_08880 [Polyangiaceae bacterium]